MESELLIVPAVVFPFTRQASAEQERLRRRSENRVYQLTLRSLIPKSTQIYGRNHYGIVAALNPSSSHFRGYQSATQHFWWLRDRMQVGQLVAVGELEGRLVHLLSTIADLFELAGDGQILPTPERALCVDIHVSPELVEQLSSVHSVIPDIEEADEKSRKSLDSIFDSYFKEQERLQNEFTRPARSVCVLPPVEAAQIQTQPPPDDDYPAGLHDYPANLDRGAEEKGAVVMDDLPPTLPSMKISQSV